MSVLLSLRPLKAASNADRAASAVVSADMPMMSGRSFPVNALSGVLGLTSAAREGAGCRAAPEAKARVAKTSEARNSMNHLQTKKGRTGIRQILNQNVNASGRFAAGFAQGFTPL